MASIEEAAKAQRAPNPQEYLDQLQSDFLSSASAKEAEARDLEDRMLQLRAEAAALRTGAGGLEAAVERYHAEVKRAHEHASARDSETKDVPVNYGDFPEPKIRISADPTWTRRG